MESDTVAPENLTKEELLILDTIMGDMPKLTLETANSGISDVQPKNVLFVTAEVHASFDYSPHRKSDTEEKTSQSNNKTSDDRKRVNVIGNRGKVQAKKSSTLANERPKKQHMVSDHTTDDNTPTNIKLVNEKFNLNNEEEIDSDSTILYDFPENGLRNKAESSEDITLPKNTLTSTNKTPITRPVATRSKKTTNTIQENKASGLNPKKSGRLVTEKILRTKKDEKQGLHKTKYQRITNTTTTKNIKKSTRKDTPLGSLPTFTYSSYKLSRSKKRKYTFHCPIAGCKRSFKSVRNWNLHHLSRHRTIKYQCSTCLKWIKTPSRFNDHKYSHMEARYKCGWCSKTFYFESGLQLHTNLHKRYKTYKCFAKNCSRQYKWPQDLLRHVKSHSDRNLHCEACDYSTHEKRLLKQHKLTH